MSEHTPTPWSVCNKGECSCLAIWCPDHPIAKVESGEWGDEYPAMRQVGASLENKYEAYMERITYGAIDTATAKANALFIVKAVNNHDSLVAALKYALDELEYIKARHGYVTTETAAIRAKASLDAVGPKPDTP